MMIAMFLRPLKIMSSFKKYSYLLHCDSILFLSLSFYIFVVSKWSPSTNSASYAFSRSQLYLHIQNDSIFRGTKFGGVCCRFASLFFWLYHLLHASLSFWEVPFTTLSAYARICVVIYSFPYFMMLKHKLCKKTKHVLLYIHLHTVGFVLLCIKKLCWI